MSEGRASKLVKLAKFMDYSITKNGQIWSEKRKSSDGRISGKWLKPHNHTGYLCVMLTKNGKARRYYVHRLILETFVGSCPDGMECRHLNGDRKDNRLKNLRWGTHKENIADAIRHGTHKHFQSGEKHLKAKLTEEQVLLIFNAFHDGAYEEKELADYFNLNVSTINNITRKKSWKHIWRELDVTA